ncbi:MAG: hypothetical protein IKR13_03180 [Victivallales bacterium]|nr:hypothetical protein [Victivallales bacterium]
MPTSHKTSDAPVLPRRGPRPTYDKRAKEDLVADFLGKENRPDVLAGLHPQSQRITKFVDKFLDKIQGPEERILGEIQSQWQDVARGDESIQKLHPARFEHGTLTLEVPDATLHYVFQQPRLKAMLLSRVSEISQGEIRQLRMVLRGR